MKNLCFGIFLSLLLNACGADHSRNLKIVIDDCDDSTIILDSETLVEKSGNTEESVTENDGKADISIPLTKTP